MTQVVQPPASRDLTRRALVEVAARLLRDGGPAAVTTRAVAAAAGVQAPTIYRLFGDKDGLLDAVSEFAFTSYIAGKMSRGFVDDPLEDLRAGWDLHVAFGLDNPALFALLCDPRRPHSPVADAGIEVLRSRVHRVAVAGRLRVAERQAVDLIHAAGTGAVLTLLALPPQDRLLTLTDAMYDAVLRFVLTDPPEHATDDTVSAAVALSAAAPGLTMLSAGERVLLVEWLDRIADGGPSTGR